MSEDRVWLLGYPVELGMAVVEHVQDWTREFTLMSIGEASRTTSQEVPEQLRAMVDGIRRTYAAELSEPDRLREQAHARGDATVDLPYPKRPEGERVVRGWQQMLQAVDAYCVSEGLLTLARTPDQTALQDWVCEQFLHQLAGGPPTAWTGPLTDRASG